MPRKARITVPGAVHHIMSRGNEGRDIFYDDDDRYYFLRCLEHYLRHTGYLLYGWALIPNHFHLVLRINHVPLGDFMRNVSGRYGRHFRKKNGNRGYVFQDRYKSIVTHDQNYIQEMIRYVHLNPLRAGLCKSLNALARFPWCGHSVYLGNQHYPIQNTVDVLKRFDNSISEYRKFIESGAKQESEICTFFRDANKGKENIRNTGCWVIGNREFVQDAMQKHRDARIRQASRIHQVADVNQVVERVVKALSLSSDDIRYRGRDNRCSHARKLIAWIACRDNNIPISSVAVFFGVNPSSVSRMIGDGGRLKERYGL